MRIDVLELRAYGPFTGVALDLSAGAHGLHVVYGPNEAGKSSALRALEAALFGIHGQTADDFVHEYGALRLGLTLRSAGGATLSAVRRKANKHPLRDAADDATLPDDALRPFLGAVDADEFRRVFGLDHVRLRDGSARLLDATGGVDTATLGAALGIRSLRGVRAALEAEAAELFKSGGKLPVINKHVARWKELQAEVRTRSLVVGRWSEARRDAEAAERARDEAEAAERLLRDRQRALELVKRNRGRVRRLADLRAELQRLADAPDVGADFESRRREAEDGRREAKVARDLRHEEAQRRADALRLLPRDFALLEHAREVEELQRLSNEVAKAIDDRERLRAKAEYAAKERDRWAQLLELDLPALAPAVEDLRLALGARERCDELVSQHTRLVTSRRDTVKRRSDLEHERAELSARLAKPGAHADTRPLARALKAAAGLGDVDRELVARRSELAKVELAISQGVTRLPGYAGTADELAGRAVPGASLLEDFGRRFRALEDEERQGRARHEELLHRRRALSADIERISGGGAVPSEQELAAARERRDAQWRLVRRAWLDGADVAAEASTLDADRPLPEAFGRSTERADDVADRLRRESERVAQLAERRRQAAVLDGELDASVADQQHAPARRDALWTEWRAAWAASGLEVREPPAMKDALALREKLVEMSAQRRAAAMELDALAQRKREAASALVGALSDAGVSVRNDTAEGPLATLLQLAEERRDELDVAARARRDDEQAIVRIDREKARVDATLVELEREAAEWRTAFAAATARLPARVGDVPDSAPRIFDQVAALVQRCDELASLTERIAKIDQDAAELRRRVAAARRAHAPAVPDERPADFVARVVELVEQRKRERQAYEADEALLRAITEQRAASELGLEKWTQTLADLAKEAGAASVEALPAVAQAAGEKREARKALEATRADLRSEGLEVEEVERRVAAFEGRDVDAELEGLALQLEQAHRDAAAKRDAATNARRALGDLERESGAAEAAAELASVGAQLREDSERYVRLVLASRLLAAAIERFRGRNEAPLLRFASRHFAGLTRDRYDRVEVDLGDDGASHFLVREAGGGANKTLDALSDGTRDQLHLALVLGSLENRFGGGGEPMPLVLDDILVHFDDARSSAALEVLAAFSRSTQVILFTHHERIREQAAALGVARDVHVHDLRMAAGGRR